MKPPTLILLVSLLCLLSCNQNKTVTQPNDYTYDYSKVLVLMNEGVSPKKLIGSLPSYKLTHNALSSRSQNQHSFRIDEKNVQPEKLIEQIRGLDFVVKADYFSTPN